MCLSYANRYRCYLARLPSVCLTILSFVTRGGYFLVLHFISKKVDIVALHIFLNYKLYEFDAVAERTYSQNNNVYFTIITL